MSHIETSAYGEIEVHRLLKGRSPYLALHEIDELRELGCTSERIYPMDTLTGRSINIGEAMVATKERRTRDQYLGAWLPLEIVRAIREIAIKNDRRPQDILCEIVVEGFDDWRRRRTSGPNPTWPDRSQGRPEGNV